MMPPPSLPSSTVLVLVMLICLLVVVRHVLLSLAPHVVFSGYVYMLVIGFCICFAVTRDFHASLLLGALLVYGRAVYRYTAPKSALKSYTSAPSTALFVVGLIATVVASYLIAPHLHLHHAYIRYALFFLSAYFAASVIEWVLHKYVMHCYAYWPWLHATDRRDPITRNMQKACVLHHDHHLAVKRDMTLTHVGDKHTLLFDWATLAMVAVPAFACVAFASWALRLHIPWGVQATTLAVLLLFFGLVWNGAHPKMHRAKVTMSLKEGPPILRNLTYPELVHRNHELHHVIKGDAKGNYNVVFLGADELFMSNNM